MNGCPDADVVVAFAEGHLGAAELPPLEDHLADCAACAGLVAELAGGVAADPLGVTARPWPAEAVRIPDTTALRLVDAGPRFELGAPLGAGGMGVVYVAHDRALGGARVALKVLPRVAGAADGAAPVEAAHRLLRFKREFRALARLVHPNLVRLGNLVEHAGQWMFSMELVEGVDFLAWTRPRDVLDPARLTAALAGLAAGVRALHAAGCVHRDLKPSNVLVARDGTVKILDFGLVADRDGVRDLSGTDAVVGTVAYMAPEQAAGRAAAPASDWWAVGAMLYEALTGRRPHDGPLAVVLQRKLHDDPPPPSTLAADIPPALDALVGRLLTREPDARAGGDNVRAALASLATAADEASPIIAPVDPHPPSADAAFLGRGAELDRLIAALDDSRATATVAFVVGDSGIGKSALCDAFADQARRGRGAIVLTGRCHEREEIPFRAVDAAIDGLGQHLVARAADPIALRPPAHTALLLRTFPVLGRVPALAAASDPPAAGEGEQALRAFAALRELIAEVAAAPLILIVDDFQWTDDDSLALLRALVRPPDAPRLLLLATVRTASGRTVDELRAALDVAPVRVDLGPLPPSAGEELARRLGAGARAADIARAAAGHPLFVRELARAQAGATTDSLDQRITRRVRDQPAIPRRAVELVCLAEAPLAAALVARALDVEPAALAAPLDALVTARLLRRAPGDRIEPYHARVREAVRADLPDDARQDGHRRLLAALRAADAPLETLVPHLRAVGERDQARAATEQLAARALAALAFAEAARLWTVALDLLPVDDAARAERHRLQVRQADSLGFAGRGAAAAEAWLAAARLTDDRWQAADLRRRAMDELVRSGRAQEALALLDGTLAPAGVRVPRSLPATMVRLVAQRAWLRLRGTRFTPRAEDACDRDQLQRVDLCASVSMALFVVDVVRRALLVGRALSFALTLGEPRRVARALATWSMLFVSAASARDRRRGARLLDRAADLGRADPHPELDRLLETARGMSAQMEGRWPEASAAYDRVLAIRLAGRDHELERSSARVLGALTRGWQGRIAELRPIVRDALRDADERDDAYTASFIPINAGPMVWLGDDDPTRLRALVLRAGELQAQTGPSVFAFQQRAALVEADLYEGEARRAWSRLSGSLGLARRILFFRVRWHDLRGRAALQLARTDGDRARIELALREARALDQLGVPWPRAHAALLRAGAASIAGDRAAAHRQLTAAIVQLDALDMRLWSAAARLRAHELDATTDPAAAVAFMRAEGIVAPDKLARALVPL